MAYFYVAYVLALGAGIAAGARARWLRAVDAHPLRLLLLYGPLALLVLALVFVAHHHFRERPPWGDAWQFGGAGLAGLVAGELAYHGRQRITELVLWAVCVAGTFAFLAKLSGRNPPWPFADSFFFSHAVLAAIGGMGLTVYWTFSRTYTRVMGRPEERRRYPFKRR
jgi:hypothetical protein